jgi:hypothetical protein
MHVLRISLTWRYACFKGIKDARWGKTGNGNAGESRKIECDLTGRGAAGKRGPVVLCSVEPPRSYYKSAFLIASL